MKSMYNEAAFAEMTYVYTDAMAELLIRKQKDYGPKNISDSPGGPRRGPGRRPHPKRFPNRHHAAGPGFAKSRDRWSRIAG